ncbi:MAG TPA: Gfo/Idh/MocA family oxidoreductase [Acidimicrobiales bacterium]|nr:Gfo/Idh/MocA family oxidoreductase [Acidimicrobiales bacterium]
MTESGRGPSYSADDPIRLGILGLGTAGRGAAAAQVGSSHCRLVAVCDTNETTAKEIGAKFGVRYYSDARQLCDDAEIEAVYIATPTYLHLANALQLASAGKHLLIEKPVVKDSAEGDAIGKLGEATGVKIMAVNTRGRDAPIRAMAHAVATGAIGRVLSLTNICYTNWVLRPRYPYELVAALGGGVTFRQAPHQVEIARTIVNSEVIAVTAVIGSTPNPVDTIGNYSALVEFENGSSATLVYNGYGYFDSAELTFGIGENGRPSDPMTSVNMRNNHSWSLDKYGDAGRALRTQPDSTTISKRKWGFVGLTVVSGENGDLRQSRDGLTLYNDLGFSEVNCSDIEGGLAVDFAEIFNAIRHGQTLEHDGAWGATTVRICEAIWKSHHEHRRVQLDTY